MTENRMNNMIIILVLLFSNQTQLSIIADDLALWLINLTFDNLNHKIKEQHRRPKRLLLG